MRFAFLYTAAGELIKSFLKALGEGDNDLLSVFKAAKETGIEWLVLENDDPQPTGVEDITRSMAYFKANL